MTDADLIYNALLRAERRLEAEAAEIPEGRDARYRANAILRAIFAIREEVGNGLAARTPAGLDAISGKGG